MPFRSTASKMARRRRRASWRAVGAILAASALGSGCASIWSRGIVQDEQGRVVSHASVRVVGADSETVAAASTDEFGCFLIGRLPPKGQRRFRLEIFAEGREPASFDFDLETPILIATLAKSGEAAHSAIHAASPTERTDRWEAYCDPPLPPGSQELAPR
jgi:hypothetical protein